MKKIEMADWRPFRILLERNLSWVIIMWGLLFFLRYIHDQAILHFFESLKYHKITHIQNGR